METMWTRGKEIHARWQNTFWSMGILEGWWYCLACEHQWPAVSPQMCPRCFMPRWAIVYNEVPIYDVEMMLIGHADGKISDGLIEVKSIGVGTYRWDAPPLYDLYQNGMTLEKIWKKIQRPFPVHVRQGMLYLHATGLPEITFIYEAKHNQDAKQFVVRYNKNFIMPLVDQCILVAKSVRGERPPPSRPEWAEDADSKICKSCEYRSTCWKLEESNGNEAGEEESVPVRVKRSVGRPPRRKATQPAS